MHCLLRRGGFIALFSSQPSVASRVFAAHSSFVSSSTFHWNHKQFSPHRDTFHIYTATAKGQEQSTGINNKRKSSTKTTTKRKMSTKKGGKKKSTKKSASKNDVPSIPHAPESLITSDFEQTRSKLLTLNTPLPREKDTIDNPCIVYWMMRDIRTVDNWALIFAQSLAIQKEVPLRVVYSLPPPPDVDAEEGEDGSPPSPADMSLTVRHGIFLLDGLKVVSNELTDANVPFDVLCPTSRSSV